MRVSSVFLYGSLRSSQPGFSRLALDKYLKLSRASTIGGCLIDLGHYPGLILFVKGVVHGELYDVIDQGVMRKLDEFELFNERDLRPFSRAEKTGSLYTRAIVTTHCGETAYVYAYNGEIIDGAIRCGELILGGDWVKYKAMRDKQGMG
jgi:gamma-glutamylcyclotransferase (GGCT)/AIG2-like uncharacterized protein YtfP